MAALGLSARYAVQAVQARRSHPWSAPSGSITLGTLNVRCLGHAGPPVVLLHGMCGSQRYWGAAFDTLAERCRLIVPDLLGFGASPKPLTGYGPDHPAHAVAACLSEAGVDEPAIVVGHSMGTLVALALLDRHPGLVDSVVAIAPPIYQSRSDAVGHIRAMNAMIRLLAFDPPARLPCGWMCAHRERAASLAPFLRPEMPGPVARDAASHTWYSYVQSMEGLILSAEAPGWVTRATKPVDLVAAVDDGVPDVVLLNELRVANPLVTLTLLPDGGHDLPLSRVQRCLALINQRVDALLATPTETAPVPPPAPPPAASTPARP
ncbi:MAG: hypothetical protein NVSMB29_00050 [Candidatus Dormibacteria bacterium]